MHIGILGAGQLGRMLAISGIPLGMRFTMYDQRADVPGAAVADIVTGAFDDLRRLRRFARRVDLVTFDWENVPVASARALAHLVPVRPSPAALGAGQDRVAEKRLFRRLGIPVAPFAPVAGFRDLARALGDLGTPGILKTRRLGYDGKGQVRIRRPADAAGAFERLRGQPLVYERLVRFSREVSLIGVRGLGGATAFYPLAENVHRDGILSETRAPYAHAALQRAAERHLARLMSALRYRGVLCVEFFVERGRLVANEMAPRVHNSGHWTIEGAATSQFENHLRAIAGLPLGDTAPRGHAVMVNLIGRMPSRRAVTAAAGVHLHDYGKSPRPGRKLGHLTAIGANRAAGARAAARLRRLAGR